MKQSVAVELNKASTDDPKITQHTNILITESVMGGDSNLLTENTPIKEQTDNPMTVFITGKDNEG